MCVRQYEAQCTYDVFFVNVSKEVSPGVDSRTVAVYKSLTSRLAQSAETLRQTYTERVGNDYRVGLKNWLLVALVLVFVVANLVSTWFNNSAYDWAFYWTIIGIILLVEGLFLWAVFRAFRAQLMPPTTPSDPPRLTAQALCVAALNGDDELAPHITLTDVPLHTPQVNVAPATLEVLSPQREVQRWGSFRPSVNLGFMAFVCGSQVFSFVIGGRPIPWQVLVIFPLLFALYLWDFIVSRYTSRPFSVEARADGLRWGRGKRLRNLPWDEALGWTILYLPPKNLFAEVPPSAIYTVLGEHDSLTWLSLPGSEASGERLARTIQEHLNLPLRNLTSGAMRIIRQPARGNRQPALRLTGTGPHSLWEYFAEHPLATMTLGPTLLLLIAGILLPYGQQWYFGGQLTHLATAAAAVRDPLTANTLEWMPAPPDAASSFHFTSSGYVFTSDTCCDASSRIASPMSNGLIEITIRQQSDFDLSQVGFLFRANTSSQTALAFTITPGGEWHVVRFTMAADGTLTDERDQRIEGLFGGVRPIHQGPDATNRLAVLMDGTSYTFYVNGQFLGGYQANDLPQSGQVGVYAEGTGGPITFSDLLISPA